MDRFVSGQFKGLHGVFVLAKQATWLYAEPVMSEQRIGQLSLSQRVRVIAQEGGFSFVTHESGRDVLGWVVDQDLALQEELLSVISRLLQVRKEKTR